MTKLYKTTVNDSHMRADGLGFFTQFGEPRTIDVHVRHLREKLERSPSEPEYIFTVRGVGYRFRDR